MAKENSQKIKLLKLMELLRQETDEQHPMAATVVCQKLNDMEVACDRRTLTRDIQALNDYGYEVMTTMISHEKAYYVEDRSFSVPELKILIDAVQAASFVTDKKTAELIEKIANLGGSHSAEILQSNMVCFNTRKHHNESIYYNVDYLEDAIEQKKKVIFYYFDLNENGEKVYRNGHHHYVVEPIALVFNEDKGRFRNTEHALLVTPTVAMNSIWLNQLLINLDLKRYQTGAAQPGLSVKNLQEIPIISVVLSEQNAFAAFVEQTDKSKLCGEMEVAA